MKNNAAIDSFNDVDALKNKLIERDAVIVSNEKTITEKDKKIALLELTIAHLQLKYFGRSSERHISPDQASLFNEAEQLATAPEAIDADEQVAEATLVANNDVIVDKEVVTRKPGRIKFPAAWPRVKVFHDLDAHAKQCSCDCALTEIDEVISEQLSIIPAQITVIENCRKKYRCDHCKDMAPITAPLPAQPLPKSNASPSALAYIATAKFLYGLPFYRLENMLQRDDYVLPRATQANWMIGSGNLIQPLINLLIDYQLAGSVMHIDEKYFRKIF